MKDDDEPKWWVTLLKLVLGLAAMISLVGLALWYADKMGTSATFQVPDQSWGIANDSPLRKDR